MKKGDPVWVGKIEWHGTKWYKHIFERVMAGGEFIIVKTTMEYPWTYIHVPVDNALSYDPATVTDEGLDLGLTSES